MRASSHFHPPIRLTFETFEDRNAPGNLCGGELFCPVPLDWLPGLHSDHTDLALIPCGTNAGKENDASYMVLTVPTTTVAVVNPVGDVAPVDVRVARADTRPVEAPDA